MVEAPTMLTRREFLVRLAGAGAATAAGLLSAVSPSAAAGAPDSPPRRARAAATPSAYPRDMHPECQPYTPLLSAA